MAAIPLDDVLLRARDVSEKHVTPRAEEVDRLGAWPEPQLRALLDAGLGGLVVPEEHGGLGYALHGLLRVCETLGESCASTAMCFGMHGVATAVLAAKATPSQSRAFLEPIVRGEHLTTLALSEPGSGSHFYIPQARIRPEGDGYVLNGTKSFVTNGGHADSLVASGVMEGASSPGEFSMVVVPDGLPGAEWGPPWQGTGMRGNSSRTLSLRDVRVPRDHLLGQEGDQTWYVFHVVAPYFLVAMSGTYLGVAQAALGEACEHLRGRRHAHSGTTLAQAGIVQHHVGRLWADLEKARRLAYYAAAQGETSGPDAMPALLSAKAEAAETAVRVTNECMGLAGGIAYQEGGSLERHLRDARAGPVMAPTTDILRAWTGRWLLGEPLLRE